jgi:hypothetical protein
MYKIEQKLGIEDDPPLHWKSFATLLGFMMKLWLLHGLQRLDHLRILMTRGRLPVLKLLQSPMRMMTMTLVMGMMATRTTICK